MRGKDGGKDGKWCRVLLFSQSTCCSDGGWGWRIVLYRVICEHDNYLPSSSLESNALAQFLITPSILDDGFGAEALQYFCSTE